MFWRILPNATICIASDRVILFDVRQDRYFMVPPALADAAVHWLTAEMSAPAPAKLMSLLKHAGVLRAGDPAPASGPSRAILCPPTSWQVQSPARPTVRHAAGVAAAVGTAWLRLRLQSLQSILERASASRSRSGEESPANLAGRAAEYDAARLYSPLSRNCLLDTLALDTWLGRGAGTRHWVFGVTGEPFAAHCWLQTDAALLNDRYERVSRYTPILAL